MSPGSFKHLWNVLVQISDKYCLAKADCGAHLKGLVYVGKNAMYKTINAFPIP